MSSWATHQRALRLQNEGLKWRQMVDKPNINVEIEVGMGNLEIPFSVFSEQICDKWLSVYPIPCLSAYNHCTTFNMKASLRRMCATISQHASFFAHEMEQEG